MLTFKTFHGENGNKFVINLASIDLITYYQDINATVHVGGEQIIISLKTAAQLEAWLGIA